MSAGNRRCGGGGEQDANQENAGALHEIVSESLAGLCGLVTTHGRELIGLVARREGIVRVGEENVDRTLGVGWRVELTLERVARVDARVVHDRLAVKASVCDGQRRKVEEERFVVGRATVDSPLEVRPQPGQLLAVRRDLEAERKGADIA